MYFRRDVIVAAILLVVTFTAFLLSPLKTINDSRFEMLFSQQLLWNHSFSLDPSVLPDIKSSRPVEFYERGVDIPYQLERHGKRVYYWFPPGSTVLSMPFVAVANALGVSATDQNGKYDATADVRIQAWLAALLMAGLAVVVFLTSRLFLPIGWSLLITAATAFGTQVWSTASRAMWVHTWGILILSFVVWLIARTEIRQVRLPAILLASCLSWLYFVRPAFGISIFAVAVYVLIYHRAIFPVFAATGALWLATFVAYSYSHFGEVLPLYYQSQPGMFTFGRSFWTGLAGTLVSPSRGLLIYVPTVSFIAYLLLRYRRSIRLHLAVLAAAIVCVHIIVISGYDYWYGGHCYGPRYCTDVMPWFALLAIVAVDGRLRDSADHAANSSVLRSRIEWGSAVVLLVCSVILNGIGAISADAWQWNAVPTDINYDLGRLWDWKQPQFLGLPKNGDH